MTELRDSLAKFLQYPILNIYGFGSQYYGTFVEGKSDKDFVVVCDMSDPKTEYVDDQVNISGYSLQEYKRLMDACDIAVLESSFHPLFVTVDLPLIINKTNLRGSISQKTDHSYVKAKKKLIDGEFYVAKKSLFHSIRIALYATELAKDGVITNWNVRELYDRIMLLPEQTDAWPTWDSEFRKEFNSAKSEFRKFAPK